MLRKYLLVCEGPTDIQILQKISQTTVNKNGYKLEIVPLAPQRDATTATFPPHGWSEVRAWCKSNMQKTEADVAHLPAQLRPIALRKNWKVIAAAAGADGVIVQMDTDIAEQISDLPSSFAASGKNRRDYCMDGILAWLKEAALDPAMFLVLPTYASETWILATHEPTESVFSDLPKAFSYEDISDAEARLVALGYASKRKNGVMRVSKKASHYESHANRVAAALATVRARCPEADAVSVFFENA